jgi:hypothetical protein
MRNRNQIAQLEPAGNRSEYLFADGDRVKAAVKQVDAGVFPLLAFMNHLLDGVSSLLVCRGFLVPWMHGHPVPEHGELALADLALGVAVRYDDIPIESEQVADVPVFCRLGDGKDAVDVELIGD